MLYLTPAPGHCEILYLGIQAQSLDSELVVILKQFLLDGRNFLYWAPLPESDIGSVGAEPGFVPLW